VIEGNEDLLRRVEQARGEAEAAEGRFAFLARASEVLGASLDYETTVRAVARLAVPQIADWCTLQIVEPDDTFRILALEHADPSRVELAWRYARMAPATLADEHGAGAVIRTGQTEHIDWITTQMLEAGVRDPDRLELLRRIGPRSALVVPLTVRDRTFGALTLASAESERRFDDRDRALAEDLAHRAATAIDNSHLYREAEERAQAARVLATVGDGVLLLQSHPEAIFQVDHQREQADRIELEVANQIVGRPHLAIHVQLLAQDAADLAEHLIHAE